MKEQFITRKCNNATMLIVREAERIVNDYQARGYSLTLRQIYYRFIALDLFPATWIDPKYNAKWGLAPDTKNTTKNYDRLGEILNTARLVGELDWSAMEDRTREIKGWFSVSSPKQHMLNAAEQYRERVWDNQPEYVEVWVEKEALVDVVERSCEKYRAPFLACRGYMSQSVQYEAGQRIKRLARQKQHVTILHLGDHDPSGMDMTRDNRDRVGMFSYAPDNVTFKRIGLNMDQVQHYKCPPNPAKETDSRFGKYLEEYGEDSWELDALDPDVIRDLIHSNIEECIDLDEWEQSLTWEQHERDKLKKIAEKYDDINPEN